MRTILVIESNLNYQAELSRLLRFEKYQVIRSESGRDGLTQALEKHPDLVLCDINTPDLTGYEILKKLRSNDSTSNIPFILLAGRTDTRSHSYAMKLGASAYLSKLVHPYELLRVVAAKLR